MSLFSFFRRPPKACRRFTVSSLAANTIGKVFDGYDNDVRRHVPFKSITVQNKSKQEIDVIFDGNTVDNLQKVGANTVWEGKRMFRSLALKNIDTNFGLTGDIIFDLEN